MFVFEDIVRVDDRGIQAVLKEVDNKQLAMALKTATPELREKLLSNMSQRAAESVKEEMGYLGPVRVSDVQAAQQAIVEIVRRLEEAGDIVVAGRGGEGELIV
jgi:flagellar motor switch protein FliG